MSKRLLVASLAAVGVLAGCVTVPTGPAVMVMPGYQKSAEQFRADEGDCRQYSYTVIGGPNAGQPATDTAASNAVGGAALGAAVGALIGAASGNAGSGAAWGAGTGLLFGSAAGGNTAGYSSYTLQRQYDIAYMQCMYSRGNQVPGQVAYRGAPPPRQSGGTSWIPPSNSAPNYPPPSTSPGNYPPPNYPPPNYPPPNYPAPTYPPPS